MNVTITAVIDQQVELCQVDTSTSKPSKLIQETTYTN